MHSVCGCLATEAADFHLRDCLLRYVLHCSAVAHVITTTSLNPMLTVCLRHEGDNQISSRLLSCAADRVSLGLLPSAHLGIPLAVAVLREHGGFMHVHGNCADSQQGIR